jgi:hypothetical protein
MGKLKLPVRYVPNTLRNIDKRRQIAMLKKSRKLYKKHSYYTRKSLPSYKNKTSKHITTARKLYNIDKIIPNKQLSVATGCSISALKQIVRKGEGAYFSSGSRPNQTPQSWGLARLASSITGGKASAVDYNILSEGCNHRKPAFILANAAKKKYGYGHSKTKRITLEE